MEGGRGGKRDGEEGGKQGKEHEPDTKGCYNLKPPLPAHSPSDYQVSFKGRICLPRRVFSAISFAMFKMSWISSRPSSPEPEAYS